MNCLQSAGPSPQWRLTTVAVLLLAAGCAAPPGSEGTADIRGSATYLEPIVLPPGSVLTVRLHTNSDSGQDSLVAMTRFETAGEQVPLPFRLRLDPAPAPGARHTLKAEIEVYGQPLFATGEPVPVLPPSDSAIELRLQRVGPEGADPTLWEQARQRGVALRAVGQEPGWLLEIIPGKQMLLATDYGQKTVHTPVPSPKADTDGWIRYHAVTEAHDLEVRVREQPCADSMSGERFPLTVRVTLDGGELPGCGRRLGR